MPRGKGGRSGWRNNCQPNNKQNVVPDSTTSCDHLLQKRGKRQKSRLSNKDRYNKDVSEPNRGNVAAGCSTNGIGFKVPDSLGDLPITGVGAYADNAVAGCGGTGDGDGHRHVAINVVMSLAKCYKMIVWLDD